MDDSRSFLRLGGWAGIGFVVLNAASFFVVPAPPAADGPADELKQWVVDNRSGTLAQTVLFGLSFALLVVFLEALRRRFSAEPAAAPMATVGALAGALFFTVALVGAACFAAAGWVEDDVAAMSTDVFRVTWSLGYLCYLAAFPVGALSLLAAAWCARRSGAFATWYSILAAIVGVLLLAGTVAVMSAEVAGVSFPTYLGFLLYVLVSAILLLRGSSGSGVDGAPSN